MALGQGWESQLMIGEETTWGTAVTPTDTLEISNFDGRVVYPQLTEDTFRGLSTVEHFRGAQFAEVEFETELRYEGYELLWLYLFGKDTVTNPNSVFQHLFEFDDAAAERVGLTVQPKHGSAGTPEFTGCKVNSAEIIYEIDKLVKVRWSLVGKTAATTNADSPTFPTAPRIRWNEVTFEKDDTVEEIIGANIQINNNYLTDRRVMGDTNIIEPVRQGRTVEGSIRAYLEGFSAANWFNQFISDNEFKLELNATGDAISGSTPSDNYDFLLECPVASFVDLSHPIPDRSPIIQEVNFVTRKDTSEIAKLTITNARTTVP